MDRLEAELKEFFRKERGAAGPGRKDAAGYPDTEDLYLYLADRLEGQALEKMLEHLKRCPEDQGFVMRAREILEQAEASSQEAVGAQAVSKAKNLMSGDAGPACPHCGKPVTVFKKPLTKQVIQNRLWLVLGIGAFLLSFVFRRYFIQCLTVSFLCGIKWIAEERATKTRIMIYKALREDPEEKTKDLHRLSSRL